MDKIPPSSSVEKIILLSNTPWYILPLALDFKNWSRPQKYLEADDLEYFSLNLATRF